MVFQQNEPLMSALYPAPVSALLVGIRQPKRTILSQAQLFQVSEPPLFSADKVYQTKCPHAIVIWSARIIDQNTYCLLFLMSRSISANEQCFSLTTNQRTVLSAMTFQQSEQGQWPRGEKDFGALSIPLYSAADPKLKIKYKILGERFEIVRLYNFKNWGIPFHLCQLFEFFMGLIAATYLIKITLVPNLDVINTPKPT